jgi:hypothetical protein
MEILLRDLNAKAEREDILKLTVVSAQNYEIKGSRLN